MRITLPPFKQEVSYVLKEHRELPLEERPVFWYRKAGLTEMAELMDGAVLSVAHRGSDEIEERRFVGRTMVKVLQKYLLRVERLYEPGGETAIELPEPNGNGGVSAERMDVLNRLPRAWQTELVNAITEDRAAAVDEKETEKN
jgi:hypothetical protein